jgi:hypothetical protein
MRADDREFLDFSIGVLVPGAKERIYSTTAAPTITTHTDAVAFADIFPFAPFAPKSASLPHLIAGLPLSGSIFHRPVFGVSETVTSWTGLERLGFPRMSVFGGVVLMKQQVLSAGGELTPDLAIKPVFGVEMSVTSLISKLGSAAKGSASKSAAH